MTAELDPTAETLFRDAAPRRRSILADRELISEVVFACSFLAAVAALILLRGDGVSIDPWLAAGLVVGYALVNRVEFAVGVGTAVPSQLVFVPMLLLLDPALVPLLVAVGLGLTGFADVLRGRAHPQRVLLALGDAWHAIAPAAVLVVFAPGEPALEHWPVYVAALLIQFAVDVVVTTIRVWAATGVAPGGQLKLFGIVFAVDSALAPIGLVVAIVGAGALLLVGPLVALIAVLARERERRIENTLQLGEAYRGSALLMGEMLEADDAYTGGEHSKGVVALALSVGRAMRLDPALQRELEFGALLHDIGKLRTPSEIINKPGKLTPEEWEIIKRHPVDGQEMLDRIGGMLAEVGKTVRAHHERWDGGGYPDGLVGENIPLPARIICGCDSFNAMTTDRAYRKAMPVSEALDELRRCSGTQFDPQVVDAIEAVVGRERPPQLHLQLAA
jgi:putative nucleotidyltransferase with HDIG domain